MTTYPTDVVVLDKSLVDTVMEEATVETQEMYSLYIPANTLDVGSRLRITVNLSRVIADSVPNAEVSCANCGPESLRGQMGDLTVELFIGLPANSAISWSHVDETNTIYLLTANRSCGLSAGYVNYQLCCKLWEFIGSKGQQRSLIPFVRGNGDSENDATGGNFRIGQSDVPVYAFTTPAFAGGGPGYNIFEPVSGSYFWLEFSGDFFAKVNNHYYVGGAAFINHYEVPDDRDNLATGTPESPASSVTLDGTIYSLSFSDSFLYALYDSGAQWVITKLTHDLEVVSHFLIGQINAVTMTVVNDNLIYIIAQTANRWILYYWDGALRYSGISTDNTGYVPFGNYTARFMNGYIYFGNDGSSVGGQGILRMYCPCPPSSELHPTITMEETEILRGSSLTVTWDNIAAPAATDYIALFSDTAIFDTSWLRKQNLDGQSSGTTSFLIPSGTTPGNYVLIMGTRDEAIFMAKSAVFVVL